METRAMKSLVLGGTGFIGGAIARRLTAKGSEVTLLARDAARAELSGTNVALGSILDPNAIARAAAGADVIFQAVSVPPGADPRVYPWVYIAGSENVIAAARKAHVPRVVMISSADVSLSNQDRIHWNEKRDLGDEPIGDRARSMRLGEEIALALSDDTLAVSAIRPGWVWGPGDRAQLPELVREARSGGISMFGEGRSLVATSYIELVVDAALAAARSPSSGGQAYYVADAEFLELREFLSTLCRALGLPPPRTGTPFSIAYPMATLRGDVALRERMLRRAKGTHFDVSRAQGELDVGATITVEEGMKHLAAWVNEIGGLDALAKITRPLPDAAQIEAEARKAGIAAPKMPRR
jgi:nucleoside-diphosphate-sugar epimerase